MSRAHATQEALAASYESWHRTPRGTYYACVCAVLLFCACVGVLSLADVVDKCINVDCDVPWRVRVAATRDVYVREGDPPAPPETTAEAVVNIYIDDTEVSCIVFSDNNEMALCARAAWTPFCSYYMDIKAAVGNLVRESYARTEVAQAVAATVATAFTVRWVDRCRCSTHELCIYMLSEKDDDTIICYTFGGVVTAQWKSCA